MLGSNTADNQHGTVSTTWFSKTVPCLLTGSPFAEGSLAFSMGFAHRVPPAELWSGSCSRFSQARPCFGSSLWWLDYLGPLPELGLAGWPSLLRVPVVGLSYPVLFS